MGAVAFDTQAKLLAGVKLNTPMTVHGFLSAKRKRSKRLVLHVTEIEFMEGA